uniref:Uncharacterized protein n=1 Tax=Anguilla anguilla TaxID=7936 RepID=A0A0E9T524_ANGAN
MFWLGYVAEHVHEESILIKNVLDVHVGIPGCQQMWIVVIHPAVLNFTLHYNDACIRHFLNTRAVLVVSQITLCQ